jgi:hypothetical protein
MKAYSGVVLLALAFPMNVLASPILDQTSLPASINVTSDFGGLVQEAQTFRVGITGTLVELDVMGSGSDSFLLDIRGQTASHPDNAVVLETVNVGGFAGGGAFTAIALNLPVTLNELLSFVFYDGGGDHNHRASGSTNSSYGDGGLWTFGNPPFGLDGPGTWYPNGATNQNLDLIFRTFVDVPEPVPEPGTLGLLALGLSSLLACISIRRGRAQPSPGRIYWRPVSDPEIGLEMSRATPW